MSTQTEEIVDLSALEGLEPPCDYGGWAGNCPHVATWILYHNVTKLPCCGRPARPFRLLCDKCKEEVLNAQGFTCPGCGHSRSGAEHRKHIGRIEKL